MDHGTGVSSDMNQAALMAIVDGFHEWLLKKSEATRQPVGQEASAPAL